MSASRAWLQASAWLSEWGLYALFAIAALPLPQTPAVAFAALVPLSPPGVFAALFLGKLVKYGLYAWGTSRFPGWFVDRLHGDHVVTAVLAALRGGGRTPGSRSTRIRAPRRPNDEADIRVG